MNLTENRAPLCRAGDGRMKKPELLSPAANLGKLKRAQLDVADAVCRGAKSVGRRCSGVDYSEADM